jgi:PTH2 family peptidyl-tRNA hydrolase
MKLAIFVRTDLDMRKGKIAVQVGHASVIAYRNDMSMLAENWYEQGQKKIVLKVPDEARLTNLETIALEHNLDTYRVIDFGLTQIEPNTWTCLAVGPDEDEKIDMVTKGYSLL